MYTIQIRIKPYLKEYLTCRATFINDKETGLYSFVGSILKPLLRKVPKDTVIKPIHGDDVFTFDLRRMKDFDIRSGNYYIPDDNQKLFQRTIRCHFKEVLIAYCLDKRRSGMTYKNIILQFCADYSITFSQTQFETLKKIIDRNEDNKENFAPTRPKLVP